MGALHRITGGGVWLVQARASQTEEDGRGSYRVRGALLWLVFDSESERPLLVELIAEYRGP